MPGLAMRSRSNKVDRTVHRDSMQPGAEIRPRFETAELSVSFQESLLDDVLGVLRGAGHTVGEPIDSAAVALDERSKGFAISVAGQRDGGGVRLRHPIA